MSKNSYTDAQLNAFEALVIKNDVAAVASHLDQDPGILHQVVTGEGSWIHLAVVHECKDMVRLLSERGGDLHARDANNNSAMIYAVVFQGCPSLTRTLLECGADPNEQTRANGDSLLHLAISKPELVKILLEFGANPNIQNSRQITPLHQAVYKIQSESAFVLIKHGGNPHASSAKFSSSPIQLARKHMHDFADDMEALHAAIQAGQIISSIVSLDSEQGLRPLDASSMPPRP